MHYLRGNFTGGKTALFVEEKTIPDLGPDDILIKVKACAVDLNAEKRYFRLFSNNLDNCPVGHEVSGEVQAVGSSVDAFSPGSSVTGILPLDSKQSGCAEMCILNQFDVVEKPSSLSHETAAATVGIGLAAYTAIHYLGNVTAGDTVLVMNGATPFGFLCIQIAMAWGAKVISTYKTQGEKQFLESLKPPLGQLIEAGQRTNILSSSIMEETGGVGVDCFIDNGARLFTSEEDKDLMEERNQTSLPHKNDIITCLGFSGKWITMQHDLQIDPPDSQQLSLRNASIAFLFPPAWNLMRAQHGRFQHILKDLITLLENGEMRPKEVTTCKLREAEQKLIEILDPNYSCVVVQAN